MRERFAWYVRRMPFEPQPEHTFPSTNYAWKLVKIKPPPAGHNTARGKRGRWRHLAAWPSHRKLTLTISYRGGTESWWLIETRGSHGVVPGHLHLDDVMAIIHNTPWYPGE